MKLTGEDSNKRKQIIDALIQKETDSKRRIILKHLLKCHIENPNLPIVIRVNSASKEIDISHLTYRTFLKELVEEGVVILKTSWEGTLIEFL